ncbi:MAG: RNA polymerase sigma factor [Bacteroidetes bacterium]|nr:RNA polymerase sigma factor [Bacteroidota bacterium]MDA0903062.1 RNA polymerase sigma factor [Bacteroidota bacterium]MDA1241728.1 RNA polymerase sigma factor [Bacteroidota bacterium]
MHIPSGYDNEAELLANLRQGTSREEAFRRVIQAWQRPLYGHLRRLVGNHDDAADALQETFLKMHRGLSQFRGDSSLFGWTKQIATRTALDMLRKRQKTRLWNASYPSLQSQSMESNMPDDWEPEDPDAFDECMGHVPWDEDLAVSRLVAWVDGLPDRQRAVFVLKYFEGLSYDQMTSALGVTEGTLKTLYHHATKKIQDRIFAAHNQDSFNRD